MALIVGTLFVAAGQYILIYIDFASLGVSLGIPFVLLLTQFSLKEMAAAFRNAGENAPYDEAEIRKGIAFFETFKNLLVTAGCFGTIVAVIAILRNVKDLEMVGKSLAVGLICIFYSVILIFSIAVPFTGALKKRLAAGK
jgi:hypothetical protein